MEYIGIGLAIAIVVGLIIHVRNTNKAKKARGPNTGGGGDMHQRPGEPRNNEMQR